MKAICVLMFLTISISSLGQDKTTFLKNWKSYPVPTNEDTLYAYNYSKNDWVVYVDGSEMRVDDIRNYKKDPSAKLPFEIKQSNSEWINVSAPLAGLIDFVEVDDGYLVGFNRGEWGGEFYWFSKDGRKKYEISGHQIVRFIMRNNKIYAIEGLAHLGLSGGSIIEIEKKRKKWTAKEYLKLPTAPQAVQLDSKDNFVVVTSSSLLSIDKIGNIKVLVESGMWELLYPSSMIIQDNNVYIGMRKGVYKFDLSTKMSEWLLPN